MPTVPTLSSEILMGNSPAQKTNPTVLRAEKKANAFADHARLTETNTVTVEVRENRLIPSSNLRRQYEVTVVDGMGRTTVATWTVDVEQPQFGGRRSIQFFGWGFDHYTGGQRISEGLCYIRTSN